IPVWQFFLQPCFHFRIGIGFFVFAFSPAHIDCPLANIDKKVLRPITIYSIKAIALILENRHKT
ncbi:hypothetical protein, partial [Methyloglobulus sp.]|uniref:hypothetical protein n=1 Tax=Methyloglobulus sp. TaxID=2518622 RepID=UPI00398A196C